MADDGYDSVEAEEERRLLSCQVCGHGEEVHAPDGCLGIGCDCREMVVHASRIQPVEVGAALRTLAGVETVPDTPPNMWAMTMEDALLLRRLMVDVVNHDTSGRCSTEDYHRAIAALPPERCPETVLRHTVGIQCRHEYDHDGPHEWESY